MPVIAWSRSLSPEKAEALGIERKETSLEVAAALMKMMVGEDEAASDDIARPEFQGQGGEEGGDHVRYFVTIGKRDGITVKELVTFIHETTGIPGNRIGDITFLEKFSFVNVPSGFADKFADSLAGSRLKGRRVNVERANASRPSGNNRRR